MNYIFYILTECRDNIRHYYRLGRGYLKDAYNYPRAIKAWKETPFGELPRNYRVALCTFSSDPSSLYGKFHLLYHERNSGREPPPFVVTDEMREKSDREFAAMQFEETPITALSKYIH